jgi:hypothetical protein
MIVSRYIYIISLELACTSKIMSLAKNRAEAGAVDWYSVACEALGKAQEEITNYPDPDSIAPDRVLYSKAAEFFRHIPPDVLSAVKIPNIGAGPNGEIFLNWLRDFGSLHVVFYKSDISGFLKIGDLSQKSCDSDGVVNLVEGLASR